MRVVLRVRQVCALVQSAWCRAVKGIVWRKDAMSFGVYGSDGSSVNRLYLGVGRSVSQCRARRGLCLSIA